MYAAFGGRHDTSRSFACAPTSSHALRRFITFSAFLTPRQNERASRPCILAHEISAVSYGSRRRDKQQSETETQTPLNARDTKISCRIQFMPGRMGLHTSKFSRFARQQAEPALPTRKAFHIRPAAIAVLPRLAHLQAKSAPLLMSKPSLPKAAPRSREVNVRGTRVHEKDPAESNLRSAGSGCIRLTFLALRGSKWKRHSRRITRAKRCGSRTAARKDLTGSNLWPVRSDCINIISTHTNVQTRSAPKR